MNRETLAAIDIGSNAIRLLINYVEENASVDFKKAAFIRVPIRLGEDVFKSGYVSHEKKEKLGEAMLAFTHVMTTFNVKSFRACATSAMREAKNGKEVLDFIYDKSGLNIEIISGKEEAETIFEAGDFAELMSRDKSYIYVDVGGGSTEITIYSNQQKVLSESFPLGTVRMLSDAVDKKEWKNFKSWLEDIAKLYNPSAIVGSGGNINKVHKLMSKKARETLRFVEIKLLYEELKNMTFEERMKNLGLNSYRADVIMPALKIFITVAKLCKTDEIIVPKVGLADGIIHLLYKQDKEKTGK